MIFDVDSNCIHPKLWIRPHMVSICHDVDKTQIIFRKSTSRVQVLWSLVVPDIISDDPWCLYIWCEALSSRAQVSEIRRSSSTYARAPGHPISSSQNVSKWVILDSGPHDFRRRFHMVPSILLQGTSFRIRGSSRTNGKATFSLSFLWSNRIQMENFRHSPCWFSTSIPTVSTPGLESERICG